MLHNISWASYWGTVAVLTAIWYLYLLVRYYPSVWKQLLTGDLKTLLRKRYRQPPVPPEATTYGAIPDSGGDDDGVFADIESLAEKLNTVVTDASRRKIVKAEFCHYLSLLFKDYPQLKISPLRPSINELVVSQCEKYGIAVLSEEEVNLLWNG